MRSTIQQRFVRQVSMLIIGIAGLSGLPAAVTQAQSVIQITNYDGTVLPASASLYTVYRKCTSVGGPQATVCEWYLRKLYGDNSAVVVTVHAPNGVDPACYAGGTQFIASGYTRSGCTVYATTVAYGH